MLWIINCWKFPEIYGNFTINTHYTWWLAALTFVYSLAKQITHLGGSTLQHNFNSCISILVLLIALFLAGRVRYRHLILNLHFTRSQIPPAISSLCVYSSAVVWLLYHYARCLSCLLTPLKGVNTEAIELHAIIYAIFESLILSSPWHLHTLLIRLVTGCKVYSIIASRQSLSFLSSQAFLSSGVLDI